MKQKTAMQQLMDLMSEQPFTFGNAINLVILNELIEKEKEQIIDAYKQACGYEYEYIDDESLTFKEQAEDYYNQTYNNGI